jgi:hypothetical protein
MKKLNLHATKIFAALLEKLGAQESLKIRVQNYMPLTIELVQEGINTPYGKAKLYSLMHHYIQNGDLMRDPEMTFLVIDARQHPADYLLLAVYPQSYQLDSLGVYEESIQLRDFETIGYLFRYQAAHCSFASLWLNNIKAQGFLK